MTKEEKVIVKARVRSSIPYRKELSKETGINDQTMRNRMRHPEDLRLYELRRIHAVVKFSDEELLTIVKGEG